MIAVLISGMVAMVAALLGTPLLIAWFRQRGLSQSIRDDIVVDHTSKSSTPTMGGTAIVGATVLAFIAAHLTQMQFTPAAGLLLFVFIGMGLVGFMDDFIKVRKRRSLGLNKTAKFLGQAMVAGVFVYAGQEFAGLTPSISAVGDWQLLESMPTWLWAIWVFLMISGFSNAVNLTDGLDGLAGGSSALVFSSFVLMGFWMFRNAGDYAMVGTGESLEIAVMGSAAMAACVGFLWFNAPPARIIMGDTGSLAIGGLLAAMAMVTRTELLLVVLGGLYVIETLSVIVQVFSFRVFGRRVFRIAPIHHHFEMLGWAEPTVVVRFWILAGIGVAGGLGIFYAEWFSRVGVAQ